MELYKGHPVLNITVDKLHQGTNKISLVDLPAMEFDWLKFGAIDQIEDQDDQAGILFNLDALASEQKLAGPFIIPNKKILRKHPKTGQLFWVTFSTEVVKEIADRFNENLNGANFNTDHNTDVNGVYVSENWIVENPKLDKALYKFSHELPAGTWYGVVKVKNTELWTEQIETGKLRGFSVEMLAGLSLAMDNAIIEQNALNEIEGLGEVPGENWKLLSTEDIAENEHELTAEEIISAQNFAIVAKPSDASTLDRKNGDKGTWLVRYRYQGPLDKRNRNFCAKVLLYQNRTRKVFRKEDINAMSFRSENSAFGTYSIFKYKGSYGCRHKWKRLIFFVDFEDDVTRNVGNVPAITRNINDKTATNDNPKPNNENFKQINMNNENQKFATVEQLEADARVVGAKVDNPDGEYIADGVTYVVAGGEITEVKETEVTDEPATGDEPAGETFEEMVTQKLAELESKIEQLTASSKGDDDEANTEKFSVVVEQLLAKFSEKLTPGKSENDTPANSEPLEISVELSTADRMADLIARKQNEKNK